MNSYKNEYISCVVDTTNNVQISGSVLSPSEFSYMELVAPCPMNRMTSYSGSGLPFPCPMVAFDNTPNKFIIPNTGLFDVTFSYPNSYYTNDNFEKIPPSIFFKLYSRSGNEPVVVRIGLNDLAPLRSLTHREGRTGPEFYSRKEDLIPPMTAEGVMRTLKDYKAKYAIA
jgi:hypothetical protein